MNKALRTNLTNLQVLHEDNHLLVVNKRPGDLVQGDKTGDKPLVDVCKDYIAKKYNKPGKVFLGVVHRLDRPTSGIVVFARTSKALSRLNKMFQEREITKVYWAVTKNMPEPKQGTLTHFMVRNPKQNKSYAHSKPVPDSKKAVLDYRLFAELTNYNALEIQLHTGRHHQIRSQLAALNCPIKGDLKYGSARSNADGGIHLHARYLELIHPVSKANIEIFANPPSDPIWNAVIESYTNRA